MNEPKTKQFCGAIPYGRTRSGKELTEYRVGKADTSLLFVTGFSAAEKEFSERMMRWIADFIRTQHAGNETGGVDFSRIAARRRIRAIPRFNPDAVDADSNGTANTNVRGVDPNRNFNADWLSLKARFPTDSDLGMFPESEAESRGFSQLIYGDPPSVAVFFRTGKPAVARCESDIRDFRDAANFLGRYLGIPRVTEQGEAGSAFRRTALLGIPTVEVRTDTVTEEIYTLCAAIF